MSDRVDAKGEGDFHDASGMPRGGQQIIPLINRSDFESNHYKMDHKQRGVAVIINNKTFHANTGMGERVGTDVDSTSMYQLLNMLAFEQIIVENDLTVNQMKECLQKASRMGYDNKDCFVCVILSHGEEGFIYGTDAKVAIDQLVVPFKGDNCQSLAGKPKIFFIQACRGSSIDSGVECTDAVGDKEVEKVEVRRIPTEADFLMAYSVVPGFYAWRNSARGSWFIQAVFDVFTANWHELDLLTMMTRVNRKVAFDYKSNTSNEYTDRKKQMPCITSMLTKDVLFNYRK